MSRPWCFSWCCPLCDTEHSWAWEVEDMPEVGDSMPLLCERDEGGCGSAPRMALAADDEFRMVPA